MLIRKAGSDEYDAVRSFYHSLIDASADLPYNAGWIKDVYPAPEYLERSIRDGSLFTGSEDGKIIASMIINHEYNEAYRAFEWPTEASEEEITVIHTFGVHPAHSGKGHARQMLRFAIDRARQEKQKVIRLDVLKGNVPAEKLYSGMGFEYLHTLPMFYEDTGWTDYELYEYRL